MNDWTVYLRATATDEDTSAEFRASVLRAAALLGVQIDELRAAQEPGLWLVPPPEDAA